MCGRHDRKTRLSSNNHLFCKDILKGESCGLGPCLTFEKLLRLTFQIFHKNCPSLLLRTQTMRSTFMNLLDATVLLETEIF